MIYLSTALATTYAAIVCSIDGREYVGNKFARFDEWSFGIQHKGIPGDDLADVEINAIHTIGNERFNWSTWEDDYDEVLDIDFYINGEKANYIRMPGLRSDLANDISGIFDFFSEPHTFKDVERWYGCRNATPEETVLISQQ